MSQAPVTPVAVIGMACRLPGGIDSPERLWEALLRGEDLVTEIPADRWDVNDYYDAELGVPGRSRSKWGAFLDDVAGFDADFFGISEREATAIDPQHRLLLETSWEAVEHAGLAPKSLSGSKTGVFTGLSHEDYQVVSLEASELEGPYGFTGISYSMASGRISYALGAHGPAVTLDTACSSGLYTVHLACQSLNHGESDLALAGGCTALLEPRGSSSASAQGMLSPTGRCRAFDVGADGFVRSEGVAMLVLKRLPDALRDNDRILAVLRGTAANQDGRTETITMPSQDAQVAVYREALAAGGVDPDTVSIVEAHGTGTPVGDPIEFGSLAQVYGANGHPCVIGSLKSNLGHTEAAAGALGLIKAILELQHGVVPRMLHFTRLPDALGEIATHLVVPQENTPIASSNGYPRRAVVSSYGMSGTNVHAVVEQAPRPAAVPKRPPREDALLFPLSSSSADELRRSSGRLADWAEAHAGSVALPDLAYTLARRRGHRPVRTAVMASTLTELTESLREIADGDTPYPEAVGQDDRGPVWVFSGQGSQWAAMGAELLATEPVFAAMVAKAEPLVARESGFSVTEAMTAPQTVTGIDRVQPTLFTIQVALAETMKSHGVAPGAVIGHSLGEVAAAVVAGALSLEDGVSVICRRSRLCLRLAGKGAMASVELPAEQVLDELAQKGITDVVVSVVASPKSTVIGGATDSVRDLVAAWEQREVMAREVAVDVASHSPQVDPILDELAEVLSDLSPMTPTIPFYSATMFDPREKPRCNAAYWVDNLRHAVRFSASVQAALEDGYRVFAELSPHPLLTRAVEQTAGALDVPVAALPAMRREQQLPHGMRGLVADVFNAGAAVDFSALHPVGELVDAPLPTWTHRLHYFEVNDQSRQGHGAHSISVHPLLGAHVLLPEEPERYAWQGEVGTSALPWLADHQIHNVAALPGAAYCEMALAAAREVLGDSAAVCDITFDDMLLLDDETPVSAVATVRAPGVVDFEVETGRGEERARRAAATLRACDDEPQPLSHDVDALLSTHSQRAEGAEMRKWFDTLGIQFGPAFTGLAAAYTVDDSGEESTDTVMAEVGLPGPVRSQQSAYRVHPALLDACFQSITAHPRVRNVGNGGMLLPLGVRRLQMLGAARTARYCFGRVISADRSGFEADLDVLDDDGNVVMIVRGLRMGTAASDGSDRDRVLAERLLTVEWQQQELPEPASADAGSWLLISTSDPDDSVAAGLVDALKTENAQCRTMHWAELANHAAIAERLRTEADGVQGVVVLMGPPAGEADERGLACGREHVRHMVRISRELAELPQGAPRLYVVTALAQVVRAEDAINLDQSGLRGLLRVIGAEHPHLHVTQIDVDDETDPAQVARELLSGSQEDETAWRNGQWYTARLCPSPLQPEERHTTTAQNYGVRLGIRTRGDLETMEFVAFHRVPPGPNQIEVAVTASSINFADVLNAMGRFNSYEGRPPEIGMDFAGVVTRVGPGVTEHKVGDHVGSFSKNGCWATFVTCDARVATTLPPGLTDEVAAAVGTAHATAWWGLHDLAKVTADDKVLIHSATGGVGQAALAICRAAGAEIFATAGSPAKRQMLADMGIEHVYDSRSIEFADQIRRDTDGYGVDVVLNSLTGAAQRASLELLAVDGRFVEIGKRDVYGNTRIGLYPFRRNLSFFYIDLALAIDSQPQKMHDLLDTVYTLVADGTLPAPEHTEYALAEAANAIRMMSAAEHTGRLILKVPRDGYGTVVLPPEQVRTFRSDGAYLVTGGLGGLGLFLAQGMAEAGCGRIVLTSRSEPSEAAREAIERIRATGADVVVECGDISEPRTADRLVKVATATGLPLRGVLHAAAVVEDATLTNISDELIDRDWAPKVYGAWYLHQAAAGQPLDWFCSFSSAAALLGSPGQGAYAAANSWLDAFTHWRRAKGLPANAVAWGAWGEIGRGAFLAEAGDTTMITPDEGAYAFQTLLRWNRSYTGYVPTIRAPWLSSLVERSPFAEMFQSANQNRSGTSEFIAELNSLPPEEQPSRLRKFVSEHVSLILRRPIDPDRPLSEYGLDSLGNLELRTRIETETGIRITSADITTIQGLAGLLCERLTAPEAA